MNPLSQREQRRKSGDVTIEHLRASGRVGSGRVHWMWLLLLQMKNFSLNKLFLWPNWIKTRGDSLTLTNFLSSLSFCFHKNVYRPDLSEPEHLVCVQPERLNLICLWVSGGVLWRISPDLNGPVSGTCSCSTAGSEASSSTEWSGPKRVLQNKMDLMLNLNGTCSKSVLIGFFIGFSVSEWEEEVQRSKDGGLSASWSCCSGRYRMRPACSPGCHYAVLTFWLKWFYKQQKCNLWRHIEPPRGTL